jgi:NAD(P)-dependent dehydrogenase (short-subunit alcohol dehydrogenase family)
MKIDGYKAVVTGGAMGIGLATVKRLLEQGCTVTIWDLQEKALQQTEDELNDWKPKLFFHQCDVTDRKKVYELAAKAFEEMGRIDILVNNAGIVHPGYFHETDDEKHVKTYDVNIVSMIYTINSILPRMYDQNSGIIVNISSAAGVIGVPMMASYSASKWAVMGLTEGLRHEAKNRNKKVRFVSVHPGYVAKGLFEGAKLKGMGSIVTPRIKSHDVIARAIVNSGIRKKKNVIYRPRSVRLAVMLRGIFPDKVFFALMRILNVHSSMESWAGRSDD